MVGIDVYTSFTYIIGLSYNRLFLFTTTTCSRNNDQQQAVCIARHVAYTLDFTHYQINGFVALGYI